MFPVILFIVLALILLAYTIFFFSPEKIGYLLILTLPLDRYVVDLPGIPFGFSIFRILLLVFLMISIYQIVVGKIKLKKNPLILPLFLFIFGFLLSLFLTDFSSRTITILGLSAAGILIVVLSWIVFDTREKIIHAVKYLSATSIFYFLFAIYTYYQDYLGNKVEELPFVDLIPFPVQPSTHLEGGKIFFTSIGSFQRLALPTGSPPRLSIFIGINSILLLAILIYYVSRKNRRERINITSISLFLVINLVMVLLTVARTGMVSVFIGIIFLFYLLRDPGINRKLFGLLTLLVLGTVFSYLVLDRVQIIFTRLLSSRGLDEHLNTRLQALSLWTSDLKTLLFGIGISDLETFFGVHSHSAFTTTLVERGLIGFTLYWFFVVMVFYFLYLAARRSAVRTYNEHILIGLASGMVIILVGSLLYEFMHELPIWVFIGLASAAVGVEYRSRLGPKSSDVPAKMTVGPN